MAKTCALKHTAEHLWNGNVNVEMIDSGCDLVVDVCAII